MAKYQFIWYSVNTLHPDLFNFNVDSHDDLNRIRKLVRVGKEMLTEKGIHFEWCILKNVNEFDSVFLEGSRSFYHLFRSNEDE